MQTAFATAPNRRREAPDARQSADAAGRVLLGLVASAFRVPPGELLAESRGSADAAFARQVAMYLAHTRLGFSHAGAAAIFGRDRTTAAHACRLVEERRDDPRLDSTLDYLERALDLAVRARQAGG